MRMFIALELSERFVADTAGLARQLKATIEGRFLPPDTYHLTLAFLGELPESDVAPAISALEAACAATPPIPLGSDGLGKFGRASDATLWLGITPALELMHLATRVRDELAARDLPFDDKPFKPHITLARRARIPQAGLPPLPFPRDERADTVTLFKSTLTYDGALYKPLYTEHLA